MPKEVPKYDGAFKKQIVEEMREKGLSYREIARQYEIRGAHSVADCGKGYILKKVLMGCLLSAAAGEAKDGHRRS